MNFPLLQITLSIVLLEWLRRAVWMSSFKTFNPPIVPRSYTKASAPKVSLIVPAKNEQKNIENCLTHLFAQDYPNLEIIVVDDRSDDKTPEMLEKLKKESSCPMKIIRVEKLPVGWTGKNHAMTVGSKAATGDWLLFTDADTTHLVQSVSSAMLTVEEKNIDYLTLAPETECKTFWEHVVQPLAVSSLAFWFQAHRVNASQKKHTLSNGQFILVKKSVYDKAGTNEAVKNEVVEDVEFAKKVIALGVNVQFLNGTKLYATRMYSTLKEIKNGWTRIFTYLFNKNILLIAHKIFLFIFFSLLSFVTVLWQSYLWLSSNSAFDAPIFHLSLLVSFVIILMRIFGNRLTKTKPIYAFLHPLGSVIMIWILSICIYRIALNRPSAWRGDLHH